MRRGDHAVAAPQLEKAAATSKSERDRAWNLRQRGNVAQTRSDYAAAEPLYRESLALYRKLKSRHDEALVLSELSVIHWWRGQLDEAEQMLREALAMDELTGLGAASTWYNLGAILNGANRLDDAREAGEQARKLFATAGHRGGESSALALLGELAQRQYRLAEARDLIERAIAIQRERGEKRSEGISLGNLARVAIEEERYDEARELCDEAIDIHRECGNKYNEGMQLMYLVDIAIVDGDLAAARRWCDDSASAFEAIASHIGLAAVHLRRGIVDELAGDARAAAACFERALGASARAKDHEMIAWVEMWHAAQAARGKRPRDAEAALARARASATRTGAPSIAVEASLAMATAVVARLAGTDVPLPEAVDWDTRVLARLAP